MEHGSGLYTTLSCVYSLWLSGKAYFFFHFEVLKQDTQDLLIRNLWASCILFFLDHSLVDIHCLGKAKIWLQELARLHN